MNRSQGIWWCQKYLAQWCSSTETSFCSLHRQFVGIIYSWYCHTDYVYQVYCHPSKTRSWLSHKHWDIKAKHLTVWLLNIYTHFQLSCGEWEWKIGKTSPVPYTDCIHFKNTLNICCKFYFTHVQCNPEKHTLLDKSAQNNMKYRKYASSWPKQTCFI